jgi:hypothetical protein
MFDHIAHAIMCGALSESCRQPEGIKRVLQVQGRPILTYGTVYSNIHFLAYPNSALLTHRAGRGRGPVMKKGGF